MGLEQDMNCPNCGAANRDTAKFCSDCGSRLIEPSEGTPPQKMGLPQTASPKNGTVKMVIPPPRRGLSKKTKIIASGVLVAVALLVIAGVAMSIGPNSSSPSSSSNNNAPHLSPPGNDTPQIKMPGDSNLTGSGDTASSQVNDSSSDQISSSQTPQDSTSSNNTSVDTPFGGSSTGKVVINEAEPNPAGTDEGNEWVELFNGGSAAVDLTGWALKTTGGVKKSYTIGGSVAPGGYRVVTFPAQFIDNSGDSVVLAEGHGVEIDRTAVLGDSANDAQTWQRVPDGVGSWQFREGTEGVSNGSPLPNPTPTPSGTATKQATPTATPAVQCPYPWPARLDTVSAPASAVVGQTYIFITQMWVQNRDTSCNPTPWYYAPNTVVTWTFSNGATSSTYSVTTDGDGTCSVSFQFPSAGAWTITAQWIGNDKYQAASASWTVSVAAQSSSAGQPSAAPPSQLNDTLASQTPTQTSPDMSTSAPTEAPIEPPAATSDNTPSENQTPATTGATQAFIAF